MLGFEAEAKVANTGRLALAGLLPFAVIGLCGMRRRGVRSLLAVLLAVGLEVAMSGCSGKYPAIVTPGVYTVNITGTGQSAGSPVVDTHTLTVTP